MKIGRGNEWSNFKCKSRPDLFFVVPKLLLVCLWWHIEDTQIFE